MATIINTPAADNSGSGMGFFFGIVLLIIFVLLVFLYGIPYVQRTMRSSTPQIQVPEKIDVNVNTP